MDKALFKKRVAKEWLIILGSIGVGLFVFLSPPIIKYSLNYRHYQKQLLQWNNGPGKEYDKTLSQWKREGKDDKNFDAYWFLEGHPFGPVQPQFPNIIPVNSSDWLILIFPYIMIQFIRSIIWAIKKIY